MSRPTRSDRAAIRPISVCIPVRVTTARPSPPRHALPLKTMSSACSNATPGSLSPAERVTGWDSPVKVERSTSSEPSIRRPSALIRSPSSTRNTSPGTRVVASTSWREPSRHTEAREGR